MTADKQPDDMQLKTEIDSIASRIDHIIHTVQQYYPIQDNPSDTQHRPDPSDPHNRQPHHQPPEQEA
ncbi:MAG: hypothetical protein ACQERN_08395 [Thermodesulfobacteriota bacterium]